jgi:hypothetical protein
MRRNKNQKSCDEIAPKIMRRNKNETFSRSCCLMKFFHELA